MNVNGLKVSLLGLVTSSLIACGGGGDDSSSEPATSLPPFNVEAPLVRSTNLTKVDAIDLDSVDKTGAWRVTSKFSGVENQGLSGSVTNKTFTVSHFYQQSTLIPDGSATLFNGCGGILISPNTSFSETLDDIKQSNRPGIECSGITTTDSFQEGNKIAYEYFCSDNKRVKTVLIERVSDLPNIGLGQGELTIEGSPTAQSAQACAIQNGLVELTQVRTENDSTNPKAQFGFVQLILPTSDFIALLELSAFKTGFFPGTVDIGEDAEAELFTVGFDGSQANSGSITITALSERRVELSFNLQFNDDDAVSRNVTGSVQINL